MSHIHRFGNSFRYAFQGIGFAFTNNFNLLVHLVVGLLVIAASLLFGLSVLEMALIIITITVVLCAEMINTALEEMVNLITNEHRKEAKIAKDVGAGMVLVASIGSVIIAFLVFTPHLLLLLR